MTDETARNAAIREVETAIAEARDLLLRTFGEGGVRPPEVIALAAMLLAAYRWEFDHV